MREQLDLEGLLELVTAALMKMVKAVGRTEFYTFNHHGLPSTEKSVWTYMHVKWRYVDNKQFGDSSWF